MKGEVRNVKGENFQTSNFSLQTSMEALLIYSRFLRSEEKA
ncbi:MAG: hypothetical protein ACYCYR_14150 [Desulfobulbaceae bacterium]|jgi:hypothetical protein